MALWQEKDYGIIADRACWAMLAVTTVIVILRLYCRAGFGSNNIGLDDYITVFCLLVILVTCILVTLGSSYGLGRHMATLDPEDIVPALHYNVIISSVLIWSFSLPKFAIIAILKRILDYGLKTTILFWFLALSSQACILATSVWWFEQCNPVKHGWDISVPGTCANISVLADLGYFTSAYSAFLDAFFALYPIPFIMRLNLAFKTRIAVSAALSLSILACIISIYKLAIFGSVFEILPTDPTYPVPYLDILGVSEGCILIVTASLPTLGPMYRAARGKVTSAYGSRSRSRSRNQLGGNSGGHSRNPSKAWGNKNWANKFRGHKLEDPEIAGAERSSIDAIPLVTSPRTAHWPSDIQKTVEFPMTSSTKSGHGKETAVISKR